MTEVDDKDFFIFVTLNSFTALVFLLLRQYMCLSKLSFLAVSGFRSLNNFFELIWKCILRVDVAHSTVFKTLRFGRNYPLKLVLSICMSVSGSLENFSQEKVIIFF